MTYLRAASLVAGLTLSAPALAEPITASPQAFNPYSRTAQAITGPIILSDTRAVFGNGSAVELKLIDPTAEGAWEFMSEETSQAQLFEVSGDPGELLQGNTLCSGPPHFMTALQDESFGSWVLELAFWDGDEQPTSINSPGLCGTYSYGMNAPVEAVTPEVAAAPPTTEVTPSPAAQEAESGARQLRPIGDEEQAITGAVTLLPTRLTFESGGALDLEAIQDPPSWAVGIGSGAEPWRLYEVSGDAGLLLNGKPLCEGQAPRFMSTEERPFQGSKEEQWIRMEFYVSDPREASFLYQALACAHFAYKTAPLPEGGGIFGPAPEPVSPGKWQVSRTTNPLDDSPTVLLQLKADSGQSRFGEPVFFVARCRSNTTEAWIVWNDYLGDDSHDVYDEWKYVTLRIGDAPASEERWNLSTDNEATFAPGWAGDLLKRIRGADQLVVQTIPYGENPVTAVFDTRGLDVVLPQLAETCHWSP